MKQDRVSKRLKFEIKKNKKVNFLLCYQELLVLQCQKICKLEKESQFFVPLYPLSNTEITKYFNYEPKFNGVYSRDNLPRIKDVKNLDDKKVKERIGFYDLLTEIQPCTLILLELNIFLKTYLTKSKINHHLQHIQNTI